MRVRIYKSAGYELESVGESVSVHICAYEVMTGPRVRVGVRISDTARLNCSDSGLRGMGRA